MGFFETIVGYVKATNIPQQLNDVDYNALMRNPWFMVPFVVLVLYMLYKKEITNLMVMGICVGVWCLTGTSYMTGLIVNGEIQMNKILPVVFGGAVVLIALIYLLLNRD